MLSCKREGENGTCLSADRHCLWQRPSCGSAKQAFFRNIKQVGLTLLLLMLPFLITRPSIFTHQSSALP